MQWYQQLPVKQHEECLQQGAKTMILPAAHGPSTQALTAMHMQQHHSGAW